MDIPIEWNFAITIRNNCVNNSCREKVETRWQVVIAFHLCRKETMEKLNAK